MNYLAKRVLWSPYNPYHPKYYYYDSLVTKYEDPAFFRNLYCQNGLNSAKTRKIIKLKNDLRFGTHIREIIATLGKPKHKVKRNDFFDYEILFYRFKMGGFKSKCELHLLNQQLFFFTYVFSYLKQNDKDKLKLLLASKYLEDEHQDITRFKVQDADNNLLIAEDACDLSILYMTGDPDVYDQIDYVLERMNKKEERHLRLQYNELYQFL